MQYISIRMHHLFFCHKKQGFCYEAYCMCVCQKVFTLKDHLGAFWQTSDKPSFFFLVSNGFCLGTLPWISFFSCFFLMVDSWVLTEAKDKRSLQTPGCWNRVLFDFLYDFCTLLLERFWQDDHFLEDSLLSQSFSTCTACSWLGFSGALELLEWLWKNFQTDRRQHRPSGDVEGLRLIVMWPGSQTCVLLSRGKGHSFSDVRSPNQTACHVCVWGTRPCINLFKKEAPNNIIFSDQSQC